MTIRLALASSCKRPSTKPSIGAALLALLLVTGCSTPPASAPQPLKSSPPPVAARESSDATATADALPPAAVAPESEAAASLASEAPEVSAEPEVQPEPPAADRPPAPEAALVESAPSREREPAAAPPPEPTVAAPVIAKPPEVTPPPPPAAAALEPPEQSVLKAPPEPAMVTAPARAPTSPAPAPTAPAAAEPATPASFEPLPFDELSEGGRLFVSLGCNKCHSLQARGIAVVEGDDDEDEEDDPFADEDEETHDPGDLSAAGLDFESAKDVRDWLVKKLERDGRLHQKKAKATTQELKDIADYVMTLRDEIEVVQGSN